MAEKKLVGVSINPDDFVQGGLIDDVDALINKVRFERFDYEGKSDPVLALRVDFTTLDGESHTQFYSAGDLKRLQPSEDGVRAVPVAGATSLIVSSNASLFIASIVNAGFPKNKLSDDVSTFDGMGCHLRRVAQAERKGLKQKEDDKREKTILVVEKILFQPGEKPTFVIGAATSTSKGAPPAAGKSVGAPPASAAPAAAPAASGDLDTKTAGYIVQILAENGGSFNKTGLPNALFKILSGAKDPDQSAILNLSFRPDFIGSPDRPWKLSAEGILSLG